MLRKLLLVVYTIFFLFSFSTLLYLHAYYQGYFINLKFIEINYNNPITYIILFLIYVGAVVDLFLMTKLVSFVKNRYKS